MAVVIERRVNQEKLGELLEEGAEHPNLDFKEDCNITEKRDLVELAKDIGAMLAEGGYIVVGADSRGQPTSRLTKEHADAFDEATLRNKLKRWIPSPFDLLVGRHSIGGNEFVVIFVGPHPQGLCIFLADGQYEENARPKTVFRQGDVFVRDGTQSRRWQQHDVAGVVSRIRAKEKELWRQEFASEMAAVIGPAGTASSIAAAPASATTWRLDMGTLQEAVTEQIRKGDLIPLELLLEGAARDAADLIGADNRDDLYTLLDRLACLLALTLRLRRSDLQDAALKSLVQIYELTIDSHGNNRNPSGTLSSAALQLEVIRRVLAVGAMAVRLERWESLRALVLQRPREQYIQSGLFTNWVRHAQVQAARANLLTEPTPDNKSKEVGLLALVLATAQANPCLRKDLPETDVGSEALLSSIVTFDALANLIVLGFAPGDRDAPYYPSFARYYWHRFEPALARITREPEVRAHIHPGDDQSLANDIHEMLRLAAREGWQFGGGGPLSDRELKAFLEEHDVDVTD